MRVFKKKKMKIEISNIFLSMKNLKNQTKVGFLCANSSGSK